MVRGPGTQIVETIRSMATGRSSLMFMVVSYPWPVASAHVALTGVRRQAMHKQETTEDAVPSHGEVSEHRRDESARVLTGSKA
jgi:hypothetical protein